MRSFASLTLLALSVSFGAVQASPAPAETSSSSCAAQKYDYFLSADPVDLGSNTQLQYP